MEDLYLLWNQAIKNYKTKEKLEIIIKEGTLRSNMVEPA